MKNIALVAIFILLLAACKTQGPKTVEINGKVSNLDANFALLMSKGVVDTIYLNDDGTFTKQFDISESSYYIIRAGRLSNTIFVSPGDVLTVEIDIKQPANGPSFDGKTSNINGFIFKANGLVRGLMQDIRALYALPIEEFTAKVDSTKNEVVNLLNESGIESKSFLEFEKIRIGYIFTGIKYDYPSLSARLAGLNYEFNPEDYSFMNDFDFDNLKHFNIAEYTSLINKHLQTQFGAKLESDEYKGKSDFERTLLYFEMIDSFVENQTLRDFFKHNSTIETVQWSSLEIAKNVADHYIANTKTDVYREIVERAIAKRMLLAPGQPAPGFTLTDINGEEHSLSDYRGKLVYIDFWATWCGPCRRQLPYLMKMKETYEGKPIAIIAISLDDDKNAWENMVRNDNMKGIQLHADKAWLSDAAQKYQVRAIPTFVLIDAEGKIIEYPAPRPSEPETNLLIDKHLKSL